MCVYCIKMSTAPYDNLSKQTIKEYYDDAIEDVKARIVGTTNPNSLTDAIKKFNETGFKNDEKRKKHLGEDTRSMPVRAPKLLLTADGKTIIFSGTGMQFNNDITPVSIQMQMGGSKRKSRRGKKSSKKRKRRGSSKKRN